MNENANYTTYIFEFLTVNGRKRFVQEVKNEIANVLIGNKIEAVPLRVLNENERSAIIAAAL